MAKILIIDDDPTITELMKALMLMEGHEPTVVNDSTLAVEMASAFEPDLITIDVMMPELSGFELCDLFHQDPKFADVPILVISARDDPGSRQHAFHVGAKDYLTKPFHVNDLLQKVNELTSR